MKTIKITVLAFALLHLTGCHRYYESRFTSVHGDYTRYAIEKFNAKISLIYSDDNSLWMKNDYILAKKNASVYFNVLPVDCSSIKLSAIVRTLSDSVRFLRLRFLDSSMEEFRPDGFIIEKNDINGNLISRVFTANNMDPYHLGLDPDITSITLRHLVAGEILKYDIRQNDSLLDFRIPYEKSLFTNPGAIICSGNLELISCNRDSLMCRLDLFDHSETMTLYRTR